MPPSTVAAMAASMMHNNSNNSTDTRDPEDLRVPGGVGGVGNPFLGRGGPLGGIPPVPGAAGPHMGSALLDTYLSMIAAAGGDSNSMAAALGAFPGRAAAFAQAASQLSASGAQQKTENTPQGKLGSDYLTTYYYTVHCRYLVTTVYNSTVYTLELLNVLCIVWSFWL